jgi:hypothetical protein
VFTLCSAIYSFFKDSLLFWEITKPEFLYCILVMTFLSMFSVYSKSTRIHFIPLFNYLYWGIVNCTSSNKSEHLGGQIDCVILNQPLLKLIAIDYHIVLCSILSPSLWGDFNSDTISNLRMQTWVYLKKWCLISHLQLFFNFFYVWLFLQTLLDKQAEHQKIFEEKQGHGVSSSTLLIEYVIPFQNNTP